MADDALSELDAAWHRTRDAGSARHELRLHDDYSGVLPDTRGWRLVRRIWSLVFRDLDLSSPRMHGTVDFTTRTFVDRYVASSEVGNQTTGDDDEASSALWFVEALGGATSAEPAGTEAVFGRRCRSYDVVVDLARASHRLGGIATPGRVRYDELAALPFRVAIDDRYVRRVVHVNDRRTFDLRLWDVGA